MIRYVDKLPHLCAQKISAAKILSLYKAFGGTPISPDFWIQEEDDKITAAISLYGGEATLYCNNGNLEEIWDFIRVISPFRVFTEKENVKGKCKALVKQVFLKILPLREDFSTTDVSLKVLYDKLLLGCDGDITLPSFEDFCADVSHRLRHQGGLAIATEYGAALSFLYDKGSVISGISVGLPYRNKGMGTKLLRDISELSGGDVFACSDEKNKDFYLKNGFSYIGDAIYLEMERD